LFDDRSNIKNYLEREAVLIVMQKAFDNELQIVGSDILKVEMSKIINEEKRNDVEGLYHALVSNSVMIYRRPPGFTVMPPGKYLAGGLQSDCTANLIGVQYNLRSGSACRSNKRRIEYKKL